MTTTPSPEALARSPAQFFFEVGFGACYAEAYIQGGEKFPFKLTDGLIERAWEMAPEAHDDHAEFDHYLALANGPTPTDSGEVVQGDRTVWQKPGRFAELSNEDLAAQCRMQAGESLDVEYCQFMTAVADRLAFSRPEPVGDEALVERVAKLLYDRVRERVGRVNDGRMIMPVWDDALPEHRENQRSDARAAIQAIPAPATDAGQSADDRTLSAAVDQNDAMRQELANIGNLVSELARAMKVDQANDDGSWPDLAGRVRKLADAARAARQSADSKPAMQHVAYFDEGQFHWMSGIRPRDCELYAAWPVKSPSAGEEA